MKTKNVAQSSRVKIPGNTSPLRALTSFELNKKEKLVPVQPGNEQEVQ